MTINDGRPRICHSLSGGFGTIFSILAGFRSGSFISNKVYFSVGMDTIIGGNILYLTTRGASATNYHSYTQQYAGSEQHSGSDSSIGFRLCNMIGGGSGNGVAPFYIHIVGEFTIIRDTINRTANTNPATTSNNGRTTRLYGTLVQYGNRYIQKWDFQGQAEQSADNDTIGELSGFTFTTGSGGTANIAVTIEGD